MEKNCWLFGRMKGEGERGMEVLAGKKTRGERLDKKSGLGKGGKRCRKSKKTM